MSDCEGVNNWECTFSVPKTYFQFLRSSLRINLHLLAAAVAAKKALKEKKKGKKQPGAPKKPMSAFFCYQQARRENLKKEAPNLDHKDIIKVSHN